VIESPRLPHPLDMDALHEECGVFGVFGHIDAAALAALGLHALQHRGQEAAGIVTYDGKQFYSHRAAGHVGDIFSSPAVMDHRAWSRSDIIVIQPPAKRRCAISSPCSPTMNPAASRSPTTAT
jgi:hypothetical protein